MTRSCIFIINILFFSFSGLMAQDFEVAPALINFDANPTEKQSKTLTIRNHNPERLTFKLTLSDYEMDLEGNIIRLDEGKSIHSLSNWVNINPAFVVLNPNESAEVALILNVPRDSFSTRWGMIHLQATKEQTPSAADKELETEVVLIPGSEALVQQSPETNQNFMAEVKDLKEITKSDDKFRSFEAVISNTGDKVIDAKIFLTLANLETTGEKQFKSTKVTVYPGFERKVSLALPAELNPGSYALAFLMDYEENSAIEGAQLLIEVK